MAYHFPYQKVLEYKDKQQGVAEQEYGTARLRQMELEQELENLQTEERGIFEQYNQVHLKKVSELLELQSEIQHVAVKKKQLEKRSAEAHEEAEYKQQILIDASREAKMWNKWKARSFASYQKQLDQKEQAMLDEMAVLRYTRKI